MTCILGVDPGLNATGWGILDVDANSRAHLHWGTIRPPNGERSLRLLAIRDAVEDVISRYSPVVLAIERPFNHRNVHTAIALGQAQAAAMLAAASHGLSVHEYPPRTVKETVAGDGSASKDAISQALVSRLGLDSLDASADAADALAIAYCHHLMTPAGVTVV